MSKPETNFTYRQTEPPKKHALAPKKGANEPVKGRFGPISALTVTLVTFFGSQFIVAIALSILLIPYMLISGNKDASNLDQSTAVQFLYIVLAQAIILSMVYAFMRWRKISLKEIGLGRMPHDKDVLYAIGCAVVYFFTTALILQAVDSYIPSINVQQEQQIGFQQANSALALTFVFICLAVIVPFAEEVLVRGFLYSGLRRKLTRIVAALVASFVFGIAHLQFFSGAPLLYVAAIDTFILSLFLIALREKTGSIWAGVFVHAIKNTIAFFALFIFVMR